MKLKRIALLVATAVASGSAFATNGMNMEGYGPVATAMGGASLAYDNGNAGIINNPATLGFMKTGSSRLDVAVGGLHPSVSSNGQGSSADAFFMPAFGYVRKDGNISWGFGMMAQGGMGTEYANGGFYGTISSAMQPIAGAAGGYSSAAGAAAGLAEGNGLRNLSEVGVGRLIFPVAVEVNDRLNIGGSIDYVWAGMDIQWMMDGAHFFDMMTHPTAVGMGASQRFGTLTGSFHDLFGNNFGGAFTDLGYAYFDFNKSGKFGQQAKGNGLAANIGFTYKVSPVLTVGGVYHPKTNLSDLDTGTNGARGTFNVANAGTGSTPFQVTFNGRVKIINFQWPETYGFGFSYQANDRLMVAADYKRLNWADVMKSFKMEFTSENAPLGPLIPVGSVMNLDFRQNWKNQDVFQIGAQYRFNDALTLRFGGSFSTNPVPDQFVTPLFPAIIKNNYTAGFGYAISKSSSIDASLTYAPKVTVTNSWGAVGGTTNQRISMSQTNWQLMFSNRF